MLTALTTRVDASSAAPAKNEIPQLRGHFVGKEPCIKSRIAPAQLGSSDRNAKMVAQHPHHACMQLAAQSTMPKWSRSRPSRSASPSICRSSSGALPPSRHSLQGRHRMVEGQRRVRRWCGWRHGLRSSTCCHAWGPGRSGTCKPALASCQPNFFACCTPPPAPELVVQNRHPPHGRLPRHHQVLAEVRLWMALNVVVGLRRAQGGRHQGIHSTVGSA